MSNRKLSPTARICILSALALTIAIARNGLAQELSVVGPQYSPVAVWPAGPLEVIVAFDRPIDQTLARSLVGKDIPFFESNSSILSSARSQKPLGSIRIAGTRLIDEGRTLILATDPHPRAARYILPLNARDRAGVTYELAGVEANLSPIADQTAAPLWSGWWPELDADSLRALSRGSRPHRDGLAQLSKRGRLTLSTLIRLPNGRVTITLEASGPVEETMIGDIQAEAADPGSKDNLHIVSLTVESAGDPLFLTTTIKTGTNDRPFAFRATYRVGDSTTDHAVRSDRLLLPWVPIAPESPIAAPLVVPDLSGGDASRGQTLFFGDQARCSQCHAFRGKGGVVGPDLTSIGPKGRAEIYRSIATPSAAIEPAYTPYTVATKDGQVVVGLVRAEGFDTIKVTDTNARATVIPRNQIDQIRPSATSIMPVGLTGALGIDAIRDLITYLTSPP
jgi:putative heme-binding domain-containing protein